MARPPVSLTVTTSAGSRQVCRHKCGTSPPRIRTTQQRAASVSTSCHVLMRTGTTPSQALAAPVAFRSEGREHEPPSMLPPLLNRSSGLHSSPSATQPTRSPPPQGASRSRLAHIGATPPSGGMSNTWTEASPAVPPPSRVPVPTALPPSWLRRPQRLDRDFERRSHGTPDGLAQESTTLTLSATPPLPEWPGGWSVRRRNGGSTRAGDVRTSPRAGARRLVFAGSRQKGARCW